MVQVVTNIDHRDFIIWLSQEQAYASFRAFSLVPERVLRYSSNASILQGVKNKRQ